MEIPKVAIKHVLFATDFSENARYACAYAGQIANQFKSKLTLLHVVPEELLDLLVFDVGIERAGGVQKRLSSVKDHFQETREKISEKVKAEYCGNDVDTDDIVVEKGNPVKVILRIAKEKNCDLIVMGLRGAGNLEDTIMGDTARRVLHRTTLPVLVVQYPGKKK